MRYLDEGNSLSSPTRIFKTKPVLPLGFKNVSNPRLLGDRACKSARIHALHFLEKPSRFYLQVGLCSFINNLFILYEVYDLRKEGVNEWIF
jgi:hypothetical protein